MSTSEPFIDLYFISDFIFNAKRPRAQMSMNCNGPLTLTHLLVGAINEFWGLMSTLFGRQRAENQFDQNQFACLLFP